MTNAPIKRKPSYATNKTVAKAKTATTKPTPKKETKVNEKTKEVKVKEPKAPKAVKTPKEPKAPRVKKEKKISSKLTMKSAGARVITLNAQANPKREGTRAHTRFSLYKDQMTVKEYIDAGGKISALRHDLTKGFISLSGIEPSVGADPDPSQASSDGDTTASTDTKAAE